MDGTPSTFPLLPGALVIYGIYRVAKRHVDLLSRDLSWCTFERRVSPGLEISVVPSSTSERAKNFICRIVYSPIDSICSANHSISYCFECPERLTWGYSSRVSAPRILCPLVPPSPPRSSWFRLSACSFYCFCAKHKHEHLKRTYIRQVFTNLNYYYIWTQLTKVPFQVQLMRFLNWIRIFFSSCNRTADICANLYEP